MSLSFRLLSRHFSTFLKSHILPDPPVEENGESLFLAADDKFRLSGFLKKRKRDSKVQDDINAGDVQQVKQTIAQLLIARRLKSSVSSWRVALRGTTVIGGDTESTTTSLSRIIYRMRRICMRHQFRLLSAPTNGARCRRRALSTCKAFRPLRPERYGSERSRADCEFPFDIVRYAILRDWECTARQRGLLIFDCSRSKQCFNFGWSRTEE